MWKTVGMVTEPLAISGCDLIRPYAAAFGSWAGSLPLLLAFTRAADEPSSQWASEPVAPEAVADAVAIATGAAPPARRAAVAPATRADRSFKRMGGHPSGGPDISVEGT